MGRPVSAETADEQVRRHENRGGERDEDDRREQQGEEQHERPDQHQHDEQPRAQHEEHRGSGFRNEVDQWEELVEPLPGGWHCEVGDLRTGRDAP